MCSGYRIAFDGKGEWSFGNDYATNVIIFGSDNFSSTLADNLKNNFLILVERDTFGINEKFSAPAKKQTQHCAWVYITMLIMVICFLLEKKSLTLNPTRTMLIFQLNFVTELFPIDLVLLSLQTWQSLNGNVHDFSVDYNAIEKFDISNIQKYLMSNNNTN